MQKKFGIYLQFPLIFDMSFRFTQAEAFFVEKNALHFVYR